MRAHELIAALDPMSEDYRRFMAAIKFDLGNIEDVKSLAEMSSLTFPGIPAPICVFQVESDGVVEFALARSIPEGVVWQYYGKDGVSAFRRDSELLFPTEGHYFLFTDTLSGHTTVLQLRDYRNADWGKLNEVDQWITLRLISIAAAVEVFSCCNVVTIEHQPPKFINAKRIAKGKVPFFSWRTLHITSDEPPARGETATGTHASPRLHLRRGHIRRIADGRRIWVRASLVGDKSKGFAGKDYAVNLRSKGARSAA